MRPAPGRLVLVPALLSGGAQARPVHVPDGTAGPDAQALAAFMVLLPVVAVLVFALARAIGWRS